MTAMTAKFRVSYSKLGKVRFLGHRDVARIWERTLRKAEIPVAMSTGFTPRPRIAFGLALPTGAESLVELFDMVVEIQGEEILASGDICQTWLDRMNASTPTGIEVTGVQTVAPGVVSLQESVMASSWILLIDAPDLECAVDRIRTSEHVMLERERKGELAIDDLRPGILDLSLTEETELESLMGRWPLESVGTPITALLTTSGRGIRPSELVRALVPTQDPWDHLTRVLRTKQWIERDGQRVDVLTSSTARTEVSA